MNKVTTINLGGAAFQLEESGYDALRAYLETGAARLQGNPDRDEVLSDIERAIADKFRALLAGHKNVVESAEVTSVLAAMGPIEADSGEGAAATATASGSANGQGTPAEQGKASPGPAARRLYRIREGRMIEGVCTGLAAYFNLDPTLFRLGFVLLLFCGLAGAFALKPYPLLPFAWMVLSGGYGAGAYVVLAALIPEAETPEQKAAASGFPATAQEFIRRAKAGYYEAMKNFPDRKARHEWRRQFRRETRGYWSGWHWYWPGAWATPAPVPVHPGMGFVVPILSLIQGAVTVLWVCALFSLLATGAVLGRTLPDNVPTWLAALLLVIAYGMVKAPLKAARRSCCAGLGAPRQTWPFVLLLDAVVWLLVFGALMWLAIHYSSQLRGALENLPPMAHQAAQDIRGWWKGN